MTATPPTSADEWRRNWPMVLAAMAGVSFVSIPTATLGLFMAPLQEAFGWNRTEISAGLTLFALISLPLLPLAGMVVDRFGPRRVALPGFVLSGLSFAAFGLLGGSLFQWFATWVVFTLSSLAISLMVWSSAVSSAFVKSRGLAIAILMCGSAIAQALGPIASRWLIDEFDWRTAYIVLALVWGGLAFVLCLFLFRPRHAATAAPGDEPLAIPGGLTVREALRNLAMYRIALATFLHTIVAAAFTIHLVPLLTTLGLTRAEAASFALVVAVASVVGKLLTGWLIDRVGAGWLPTLCYGGPALTFLLLLNAGGSLPLITLSVALQGYCAGASLQLTAYLTTRFAGLRNFATIFGLISMLLALAGGLGPLVGGVIFDAQGSYGLLLIAGALAGLVAGFSVLGLGRYPEFPDTSTTR